MSLGALDILVFVAFVVTVVSIGLLKSRKEKTGEDYFLAGRGLSWWLIGFSLIAANISTEQFVGMSGQAADWLGMAIASYEWMAAITLIVVAFLFLPSFLKSGIYTIPEFLEYRYNAFARTIMAISTMIIYAHRQPGWFHKGFLIAAAAFVMALVWLMLRLSIPLSRKLGKTGLHNVTRIMGLLLAAIAVEFIVTGLLELLPGLR